MEKREELKKLTECADIVGVSEQGKIQDIIN